MRWFTVALSTITIEHLLASIVEYHNDSNDIELVKRAYQYASFLHRDQKRKSGEPYMYFLQKKKDLLRIRGRF